MPPFPPSAKALSLRHPLSLHSLIPSNLQLSPRSDAARLPTRTIPPLDAIPRSLASLFRRQVTTVTATASPTRNTVTATPLIPANYATENSSLQPGTVVGIVFGSVAGFLLLLWLIYTCFGSFFAARSSSSVVEEEVITRHHSRSNSRRRSSPRRSSPRRPPSPSTVSASEVIEVRSTRERTRSPPRRERTRSPSRRETPPRRERRVEERVIIEETRRPVEDDLVEVIEEHSPPPPRERSRKPSGYRTVDPEAFGGGQRPMRKVSRR